MIKARSQNVPYIPLLASKSLVKCKMYPKSTPALNRGTEMNQWTSLGVTSAGVGSVRGDAGSTSRLGSTQNMGGGCLVSGNSLLGGCKKKPEATPFLGFPDFVLKIYLEGMNLPMGVESLFPGFWLAKRWMDKSTLYQFGMWFVSV